MALLKGKFVSKDEAIQSNTDPSDAKDLSRKSYVDSAAASAASSAAADKVSKSGDTMTGNLTIEDAQLRIDSIVDGNVFQFDPNVAEMVIKNDVVSQGTLAIVMPGQFVASQLNETGDASLANTSIEPGVINIWGAGTTPAVPTNDAHAVNKKYVDDSIAAIDLSTKADLVDGKVPSTQLPSYVDDVLEYDDLAALPATGETSKIYVTKDTNKTYRWGGSSYIEISASPGSTDAVAEGSTNLYFTNERAKAAAVTNEIIDGVIDVAPSQDAVHEALAGKQASLGTGTTSQFLRGDLTWAEVPTSVGIAQVKIVSKGGVDATGDGTLTKPYATVGAALASITDASPTKRYLIKVQAGAYTEGAIALKANVFICGDQKEAVRISATSFSLASDFSGSADNRSGMSKLIIAAGNANFDWSAVTSAAGKLYFSEVSTNGSVTLTGHNNAIAQAQFDSCIFFAAVTVSGINVGVANNNIFYGNVTLNQHPNGGMATIFAATGGSISGTLRLNTTVNDFGRRCSAFLKSCYVENLIIDGAVSYVDCDLDSQGKSSTQKLNGGTLVALTSRINHDLETQMLKPLANNTHNLGDWGKQWMFHFAYVHASAGTDMYLLSAMENYNPAGDSAGRSIFINPDAYGLQADVSGGNIELETAAVSGTGVRGKVQIKAKELDMTNTKIRNLANATDSADAVNKGQLDFAISSIDLSGKADVVHTHVAADITDFDSAAQSALTTQLAGKQDSLGTGTTSQYLRGDLTWAAVPAALTPKKETFVLTSTDLSNAYLDCAFEAAADSMLLMTGGIPHQEGASEDYTLSIVGNVTRISINSGLLAKLSVGDRVYVMYQK